MNKKNKPGFIKGIAAAVFYVLLGSILHAQNEQTKNSKFTPVLIEFFFEEGCSQCRSVEDYVLPSLAARYTGFYELVKYNTAIKENYLKLASYQKEFANTSNEPVFMVLDREIILSGAAGIKAGLFADIDRLITRHLQSDYNPPNEAVKETASSENILLGRLKDFRFTAVALAGFIDGINPCALSTLIFFVSVLIGLKVKNEVLMQVGAAFCIASFITYTLIGLGLMQVLYLFKGFAKIQFVVELIMVVVLALFAILSLKDAWLYSKHKTPDAIKLKLPAFLTEKIHSIFRHGISTKYLIPSVFLAGALVTVIESVCTGQVYVPTLTLLVKSGESTAKSAFYLFTYNAMFVMPLIFTFILVIKGASLGKLIAFSKEHVVASKILMGALFISLLILFVILS